MSKNPRKPDLQKKLSQQRIKELFDLAKESFSQNKKISNRYIEVARKIAMKNRLRIPATLQKKYCKHCYSFLSIGTNCRVRTKPGRVIYYCYECKKYMRFLHK